MEKRRPAKQSDCAAPVTQWRRAYHSCGPAVPLDGQQRRPASHGRDAPVTDTTGDGPGRHGHNRRRPGTSRTQQETDRGVTDTTGDGPDVTDASGDGPGRHGHNRRRTGASQTQQETDRTSRTHQETAPGRHGHNRRRTGASRVHIKRRQGSEARVRNLPEQQQRPMILWRCNRHGL